MENNKYTFLSLAKDILSESDMPMRAEDIWNKALEKGLDKKVGSSGKTPTSTLSARLYTDVKRNDTKFIIVSRKPTLFWLSNRKNELTSTLQEKIDDFLEKSYTKSDEDKDKQYHERDIHPVLAYYISDCPLGNIHTKTIFHENSKKGKKGQDKWNYPDMAGVSFVFPDYDKVSIELMKLVQYPMCKFYSFELKKSLNFGNYKEAYFQSVSNSSWANEGYLVCIDIDDEVKHELKRLCDAFGIGLIQLDIDNIDNSTIIYPATVKPTIDMAMIDLLVDKNENFQKFINNVNNSLKVGEVVNVSKYDKVLSDDEIIEYLSKLKTKNNKNS